VKPTARYLVTACTFGLFVAGISSARPSWAADLGLDFWNVPALKARLAEDHQLASKLSDRDDKVMRRIAVKETIIEDLVAGRIGLLDAAAEFRALNAGRHAYVVVIRSLYPNMSDEERMCRNVISYVESFVEGDEDGRALIHRLNEDLHHIVDVGSIHLPGPAIDLDADADPDDGDAQ
jgi:hypothetical protein